MSELKLQRIRVPLPDDSYTENAAFRRLANRCAQGDGNAMWEMGNYFAQMHKEHPHTFFPLASNFWRYFAYLCGVDEASNWYLNWKYTHPGRRLAAVLDERRSGKSLDGGIFRCLGFLFFQRGVIYDVYPTGNLGVTHICIHPHEDGTFESAHYEHTFLDEYLNPLPIDGIYFHPNSKADKSISTIYLFSLMRKAIMEADKRNRKIRENSTFIRIR